MQLARDTEPLLFGGLLIMLVTGIFLFLCFATKYYYLAAFWAKLAALFLVLVFTFTIRRRVLTTAGRETTTLRDRLVATVSLALWTSVALGGRLIGFP
jgi:phosphoglycerol transferase MdoB-like AlkP superfamily enzyme